MTQARDSTTRVSKGCRCSIPHGIAAATVSTDSARIGDPLSTYQDGVLSALNDTAKSLGLRVGMPAQEAAHTDASVLRQEDVIMNAEHSMQADGLGPLASRYIDVASTAVEANADARDRHESAHVVSGDGAADGTVPLAARHAAAAARTRRSRADLSCSRVASSMTKARCAPATSCGVRAAIVTWHVHPRVPWSSASSSSRTSSSAESWTARN